MDLSSKKIIVTGCAHGIGEATVKAYVMAGAEVVGMDIQADKGAHVVDAATRLGPGFAHFLKCDVASRDDVDAAFKTAVKRIGRLDVLTHVAGVHQLAPTHDVPDDMLERIIKININGTIFTNGAAYRHMDQGGAIINFGSESGLTAEPNNAVYGASKGAVHTWTRSVAREWGRKGIRVNAVLPLIETPMIERFRETLSEAELAAHSGAVMLASTSINGRLLLNISGFCLKGLPFNGGW